MEQNHKKISVIFGEKKKMSNSPETLTVEESEKLLSEIQTANIRYWTQWKNLRNYTMTLLMLDAGLRVGEVCRLKVLNLVIAGQPVNGLDMHRDIAEKKCERLIPLTPRLLKAVLEMQKVVWSATTIHGANYAFTNEDALKPISTRQVQRIISRASYRAFGRCIHPHVLRHTFATRLMRITSAPVVQQLLGHKRLTSTQVYTHPNGDDCKKAIDNMSAC